MRGTVRRAERERVESRVEREVKCMVEVEMSLCIRTGRCLIATHKGEK